MMEPYDPGAFPVLVVCEFVSPRLWEIISWHSEIKTTVTAYFRELLLSH